MNKKILFGISSFIFTFIIAFSFWWLATPRSLTFSDSVRYADAARSLVETGDSVIHHSYFSYTNLARKSFINGWQFNSSPVTIKTLSFVFHLLPANDLTVTLVGITIFSLSGVLVFLIASNLYSITAGLLSLALFSFNSFFLNYAVNNSSEIYLVLEILLATYFIFNREKLQILLIFAPLILMLYTRPQAAIFLVSLILFLFLDHLYQKSKQPLKLTVAVIFIGLLSTLFFLVLSRLTISHQWSINFPHLGSIFIPTTGSPGQFLRGNSLLKTNPSIIDLVSKLFYNTYNFLKNITRLINLGVFWLFVLGIFIPISRKISKFNLLAGLSFTLFILGASITLPNARYVHPITPLLIIGASIFLVNLFRENKVKNQNLLIFILIILITLPVWGNIFIDYRFRSQNFNLGKPPVYQEISREINQRTLDGKLILTNLDAWGAWYQRLTTMWFPLSPNSLVRKESQTNLPKYIVITNYKEDDGDFSLGDWSEVVYSPENIQSEFLRENYTVLSIFTIPASKVYENKLYQGTILIKK